MADIERKIDELTRTVGALNQNVAVMSESVKTLKERGSVADEERIRLVHERIDRFKVGGIVATAVGTAVSASIAYLVGKH